MSERKGFGLVEDNLIRCVMFLALGCGLMFALHAPDSVVFVYSLIAFGVSFACLAVAVWCAFTEQNNEP